MTIVGVGKLVAQPVTLVGIKRSKITMATNQHNQNQLKTSYTAYKTNGIKTLVKQIPEDRKETLAEEILARANLFGCENKAALQRALKHLVVEQKEKVK